MNMSEWIESGIQPPGPAVSAYLAGRGLSIGLLEGLGMGEWNPPSCAAPSSSFSRRYGSRGQALGGRIAVPIRSPRGVLIGLEARAVEEKLLSGYRTSEAAWNPSWVQTPDAPAKLWAGGRAWIVEGLFDLVALYKVVPQGDAVFATLRAALGRREVEFLRRYCTAGVIMAYDNDETGRRATDGWYDEAEDRHRMGAIRALERAGVPHVRACKYLGKDPGVVWETRGIKGLTADFGGI
jgi:hypothetical protein